MSTRQKIIFGLLLILTISAFYERGYFDRSVGSGSVADNKLDYAYQNQISNLQVEGAGVVEKVLQDDNEGSRHQRLILRVGDEQTVLIAHNIDLAPRVEGIEKGDRLEFFGEYEWNKKGGVIHWTHRDPGGKHIDGWLRHKDKMYQ